MYKFKKFIGLEEEPNTMVEELQDYLPHLSYKQRFIGFLVTVGIAILFIVFAAPMFLSFL